MSKIGRKHIALDHVQVEVKNTEIHYKGPKAAGIYELPELLVAEKKDNYLMIRPSVERAEHGYSSLVKEQWGLHRALLAAKIAGAANYFTRQIEIVGLGFKVIAKGSNLEFTLGYSHKKMYELPQGVTVVVTDKAGQKFTLSGTDNEQLGQVASEIQAFRKPEPYKGTGILIKGGKQIRRKAGKTK